MQNSTAAAATRRSSFKQKPLEHKQFKVIVVGCSGVGKTSIIGRYVYKSFDTKYKATIGFDLAIKQVNEKTSLQLWDLSGQDRFFGMSNMFCRGAMGIVIVYDVTEPDYLDQVEKWAAVLEKLSVTSSTNRIPIIAFGNKLDALDVETNARFSEGQSHAEAKQKAELEKKYDIAKWCEGSAKFGSGIDEAFGCLVDQMVSYQQKLVANAPRELAHAPAPAAGRTVIKLCDDEEEDIEEAGEAGAAAASSGAASYNSTSTRARSAPPVGCSSCSNGHPRTEVNKSCKATAASASSSTTTRVLIRV